MQTLAKPPGSTWRTCAPRPSSGHLLLNQAELPALLLCFRGRRVKWEVQLPSGSHAPEATAGRGAWLCPFSECLSEPLSTLHNSPSVIFLEKTCIATLKVTDAFNGRLPPHAVSCSAFSVQRAAALLRSQSACLLGCSSNPIVTRVSEKRKQQACSAFPSLPAPQLSPPAACTAQLSSSIRCCLLWWAHRLIVAAARGRAPVSSGASPWAAQLLRLYSSSYENKTDLSPPLPPSRAVNSVPYYLLHIYILSQNYFRY